jgi:Xaa-Pro aminopeptidase
MFQSFSRRTRPETGPERLAALRGAMRAAGIDAFLLPRADAHQGETVAPRDERLAWLTSFTGSAGLAVVTAERAAIFVDGRYRLQAAAEVDTAAFEIRRHPEDRPGEWLKAALPAGGRIGFDPWLHTAAEIEALEEATRPAGLVLDPVDNLVDAVWPDQPPPPAAPAFVHPEALAGRSPAEKRAAIAHAIREAGLDACVITLPDSIAWLLNIRGGDIARNPVMLAFAILDAEGGVRLFVDAAKIGPEIRAHLGESVRCAPPEAFGAALAALAGRVGVDRATAPVWVSQRLAEGAAERVWFRDPCILPKAQKNPAEIAGARAAHLRDGAAMADFLAWLDRTAPEGGLTEIDIVRALEARRRATGCLHDIAFETIAGAGPNGAIVHYRVSEASNRRIAPGEILLVDSGGQYADGTTDVTRTVAVGPPLRAAIRPFTLVLRGMIAMARLRWPEGLAGRDLDAIARASLWQAGLDYDHGTGHGVGAFLSVHEGPAALSRRSSEPIRAGMILSNEPGCYREGEFGIRIENLQVVLPAEIPEGGERAMHGFETLTLVPIDTRLVDPTLLLPPERDWLDAYHAHVHERLAPLVASETRDWLARACAPLRADRTEV